MMAIGSRQLLEVRCCSKCRCAGIKRHRVGRPMAILLLVVRWISRVLLTPSACMSVLSLYFVDVIALAPDELVVPSVSITY